MAYCTEDEVYEASGLTKAIVKSLSGKDDAEVTTLINKYIAKADTKVKRRLKVPITIRKELHLFDYNNTVELGCHEDEFEVFSIVTANCVESIYALYRVNKADDIDYRVKLPYPKDCDKLTEDIIDMSGTNVTLSKESTTVKCGTYSIKAVFSVSGSFYFPTNGNLEKNIEPWDFIGFWFRTNDKTVTFTIKLYDKDGNTVSEPFTLDFADTWTIVSFNVDEVLGAIDWGTVKLQKIEILADKACTCYFDNFNFNDGYFWTYPEGLICWSDPNSTPWNYVRVTYSYDPYKVSTPSDLSEASSKLAGVLLLDYCIGLRVSKIGFKHMAIDLEEVPEKITMEVMRNRLKREAADALAGIGYGTHEGLGTA